MSGDTGRVSDDAGRLSDQAGRVSIRPWREEDLPLLERANEPGMTAHLGGPEPEEKVRERHEKYLRFAAAGEAGIFAIELDGVAVGGVNWWPSRWHEEDTLEIGWFLVAEAQGRGVATRAVRSALADARSRSERRRILAFPDVANAASNRLCARAGFSRIGEEDLDYRDTVLHAAVWSLDLDADGDVRDAAPGGDEPGAVPGPASGAAPGGGS